MQFDKAVIGKNINSAIHILKCIGKNENIAHIVLKQEGYRHIQQFNVFVYKCLCNPFAVFMQQKVIKILKQKAAHLLVSTSIVEYKYLSKFDKVLIKINNLFFTHQVKAAKHTKKTGYYKLSYKSYKFSTNRLINSIIKSANSDKYKLFNNPNNCIIQNPNTLTIDDNITISVKKIIEHRESKKSNTINVFWFSYSNNEKLDLDKTIIKHTKEGMVITIMPWFDYVYIKITSKNKLPNQIERIVEVINNEDIGININKDYILTYGTGNEAAENYYSLSYLSVVKDKLSGSNFEFGYNPWKIMEFCDIKYDEAKAILKSSQVFKKMFYKYGTEIDKITCKAYEFWNELKNIEKTWLKAEIWYLVKYEHCTCASEYINAHTAEWLNPHNLEIEFIKTCFSEIYTP